jgi:hypothetical protein
MRYDQVDQALEFLDDDSFIVLQVPYFRDIQLVRWYLREKLEKAIIESRPDGIMLAGNRHILIEAIGGGACGYGVGANKCFFIDRDHDRSYMDRLEVTGCV